MLNIHYLNMNFRWSISSMDESKLMVLKGKMRNQSNCHLNRVHALPLALQSNLVATVNGVLFLFLSFSSSQNRESWTLKIMEIFLSSFYSYIRCPFYINCILIISFYDCFELTWTFHYILAALHRKNPTKFINISSQKTIIFDT